MHSKHGIDRSINGQFAPVPGRVIDDLSQDDEVADAMVLPLRLSLCIAASVLGVATLAAEQWEAVSVDMPHGGRRLVLKSDGTAHYFYAALPTAGPIKRNSLSFDRAARALEERAQGERCAGESMGLVTFHQQGQEGSQYYICDQAFVLGLFAQAFRNREPAQDERTRTLNRIWREAEPLLPGL